MTVRANIQVKDEEVFEAWINDIKEYGEEATIRVAEELGDEVKKEVIAQLKHIERQGKLPKVRKRHMHQDVKKTLNKKYGFVAIYGGNETGTLWHIVNDGSVHVSKTGNRWNVRATHFLDAIMAELDNTVDEVWDKIGKDLLGG